MNLIKTRRWVSPQHSHGYLGFVCLRWWFYEFYHGIHHHEFHHHLGGNICFTLPNLGGGVILFFLFSSQTLGKMNPFWRLHIFQMGWFNHQPVANLRNLPFSTEKTKLLSWFIGGMYPPWVVQPPTEQWKHLKSNPSLEGFFWMKNLTSWDQSWVGKWVEMNDGRSGRLPGKATWNQTRWPTARMGRQEESSRMLLHKKKDMKCVKKGSRCCPNGMPLLLGLKHTMTTPKSKTRPGLGLHQDRWMNLGKPGQWHHIYVVQNQPSSALRQETGQENTKICHIDKFLLWKTWHVSSIAAKGNLPNLAVRCLGFFFRRRLYYYGPFFRGATRQRVQSGPGLWISFPATVLLQLTNCQWLTFN